MIDATGAIDQNDPTVAAGIMINRGGNTSICGSSSNMTQAGLDSHHHASSLAKITSPFLHRNRREQHAVQQRRQHRVGADQHDEGTRKDDEQDSSSFDFLARDLSALMGGAPVPRLFATIMRSRLDVSQQQHQQQQQQIDTTATTSVLSPIQSAKSRAKLNSLQSRQPHDVSQQHPLEQKRDENDDELEEATIPALSLSHHHARFLDEELHLKLRHERERVNTASSSSFVSPGGTTMRIDKKKCDTSGLSVRPAEKSGSGGGGGSGEISVPAVMHCRELGHHLADKLGGKFGSLLHGVVDVLCKYGLEQQEAATRAAHELFALKNRDLEVSLAMSPRVANINSNHNTNSAAAASISPQKGGTTAAALTQSRDDGNEEKIGDDSEAERRRLHSACAALQNELVTEREALVASRRVNGELRQQLADETAAFQSREEESRAAARLATERYDELEHALQAKKAEMKNLLLVIKGLEVDVEERLWVSTMESESTAVREMLLRKHCKDTEGRCAVMAVRMRQEQEMVLKLRRKLADVLGTPLSETILDEFMDGVMPMPNSATTPRPDKDHILRSVAQLGKTHSQASTASIVEALLSLVQSLEGRLRAEERSMAAAQDEAEKALQRRRERVFVDVDVQTA